MNNENKKITWDTAVAEIWSNYVPPGRPSCAELTLYTRHLRDLQKKLKRRIRLLVLGSTPEFRDWGFEEDMEVTVVDYSRSNYDMLSSFMRHPRKEEIFCEKNWTEMSFNGDFDLVVADYSVSVLKKEEVPIFLKNVANCLDKDGLFITKQYIQYDSKYDSLEDLVKDYYKNFPGFNIFLFINDIINLKVNKETSYFIFEPAFNHLKKLYENGLLKEREFKKFSCLNLTGRSFDIFVPTTDNWEKMVNQYLKINSIEHSEDFYSETCPIYILKR